MTRKPRPKSQKRKRNEIVAVRLTVEERELLELAAAQAGLKPAGFLRKAALGRAGPRSQKQPKPQQKALAKVNGQLGKIGGNLTQLNNLLRDAHTHGLSPKLAKELKRELDALKEPISDMRAAWLKAIGRDEL